MKLLSKKVKDYSDLNGLERLLYDTQEKQTLPDSYTYPTKKYERGMLISISNNRTYYEEIIKRYKEQYLTLLYCLTGKNKYSKWDIKSVEGIPTQEILIKLIQRKIPIMVCGIHDYKQKEYLYKGSLQGWEYQHQHLYIYGMHHHLDSEGKAPNKLTPTQAEDMIQKLYNPRYTNNKRRIKDAVRITEVGTGQHIYTDPITPNNLYDYLTNPVENTLIHYIKHNRHKPTIQYPLKTIYLSPTKNNAI